MRSAIFLVTAMSCMVIAAGFFSRDNWIVGSIIGAVGIYYVGRVFLGDRLALFGAKPAAVDAPSQPAESRPGRPTKDETAELRAELEAMLVDLRKRMIATRSVFMLLGGGAAILFFFNWQLAVALLPFAAIFGFLYFRNAKAVALLENGL